MTLPPDAYSKIIEIALTIFLIAAACVLKIIKSKSDKLFKEIKEQASHDPAMLKDRVKMDVHIYNELYKILFVSNASRAYVLQFHNGSVFSTNNPIWKFSKTYEICNSGVASEVESTQNILIAHMTQLLNPLFNNDLPTTSGITKLECATCSSIITNNNFRVYKANADKISHYYISAYLMNRSIKECIFAPIFNNGNNIIGLICLDYCNDYQYDDLNEPGIIKELYKVSAKVSEKI